MMFKRNTFLATFAYFPSVMTVSLNVIIKKILFQTIQTSLSLSDSCSVLSFFNFYEFFLQIPTKLSYQP